MLSLEDCSCRHPPEACCMCRKDTLNWMGKCHAIALKIMQCFATGLGLPEHFFDDVSLCTACTQNSQSLEDSIACPISMLCRSAVHLSIDHRHSHACGRCMLLLFTAQTTSDCDTSAHLQLPFHRQGALATPLDASCFPLICSALG